MLADTRQEASWDTLGVISLWSVVVPSSKIVTNLSTTYDKLHFKEEPYRFSSYHDPSVQAVRQTSCYFYIRMYVMFTNKIKR